MTAIEASTAWIQSLLFGPVATSLMALAVAAVGFRLLLGYGSVREAGTVLAGCFVLTGASQISARLDTGRSQIVLAPVAVKPRPAEPARPLPKAVPPQENPSPFFPYTHER